MGINVEEGRFNEPGDIGAGGTRTSGVRRDGAEARRVRNVAEGSGGRDGAESRGVVDRAEGITGVDVAQSSRERDMAEGSRGRDMAEGNGGHENGLEGIANRQPHR